MTALIGRMGPAMRLRGGVRGQSEWNRRAFAWWQRTIGEKCARCGYTRGNVRHEIEPETAPEGPDYYRRNVPDRHIFEPIAS